ncbi:hypothetical protein KUTeg_011048 [Tegillarca granosa]|uniref:MIF4G domain-containing protein n=1 Tax=Tegillarca granosa TaxID=220873 RepID=A0ABQ9F2S5_TEGGR|nr:hypothetical protein KUTeg_011048 [Tegillarca granosa]
MASKGRGRGRGLLRTVAANPVVGGQNNTEKADGDTSGQFDEDFQDLESRLANLTLDIDEEVMKDIVKLSERIFKDESRLNDIAANIYKKCLQDREFAKTGAILCERLTNNAESGANFRTALLKLVQVDFKEKDEIRKKSTGKFLNLFAFICQLFSNMKDPKGEPFKVFLVPIYECLNTILHTDIHNDDEYECVLLQLQGIGRDLESLDAEKMNVLMEKIRHLIIKDGATARGRCTLLELLECYSRSWKSLPNETTRFYCDTMADILAGMVV